MSSRHRSRAAATFPALAALAVATALTAVGPTSAGAAPATMRTLLHFTQSAWTSPVAVVLHTPDEWTRWNDLMVAAERAVAPEPLPAGVDWCREAVLVVAIGERPTITTFTLDPARRLGHTLYLTGRVETSWTQTFSAPCHVVAIDCRYADSIVLDPAVGTLEHPFGRPVADAAGLAAGVAGGGVRVPNVARNARTWGAVKELYR